MHIVEGNVSYYSKAFEIVLFLLSFDQRIYLKILGLPRKIVQKKIDIISNKYALMKRCTNETLISERTSTPMSTVIEICKHK